MQHERKLKCPASPPPAFERLWNAATEKKKALLQISATDRNLQILALQRKGSEDVMLFINDIATGKGEEEAVTALAAANAPVGRILCLWITDGVDLPSYAFRKALTALNAANGESEILLLGEHGLNTRTLASTM